MPKILSLFLLLLFATNSYSQEQLYLYKEVADKAILPYFDKSLIDSINCTEVSIVNLNGSRTLFPHYDTYKNDSFSLLTVTFSYSFFAKSINDYFNFKITVDKYKNIKSDSILFSEIPKCISANMDCAFIKKDSAVKIALLDSIEYSDNLSVKFTRPFNKTKYYWIITGYPKKNLTKNAARKATTTISIKQRKIIDALSGEIISWEEYSK
jgi:hypothetical protein